jgi:DNA segregation ATPase FtsK/SpoIIIE-like protein
MIDEMGDLMDIDAIERKADKEKYETTPTIRQWIKQAVQIGRAAGVHIIACTQRASVKVVDGDIKANLPCRIALRLPTEIDSRTILGYPGAENLLGKGDMLIQRPEKDVIERFHGPYVSMDDIQNLVCNYNEIRRAFSY